MRILNVRTGFATNSSSTHSIVFMRGKKLPAVAPEDDGCFGWENFSLVDRESKLGYLGVTVYEQLRQDVGYEIALKIASQLVGLERLPRRPGVEDDDEWDQYVDHKSNIALPRTWDGKGLELDFLGEFASFLAREDVAILGGNDNEEPNQLLNHEGVVDTGYRDAMFVDTQNIIVARKDPSGFWTLFNRSNGTKLRIALTDGGLRAKPEKSYAPELVDVKITDFCPFGCAFCYQDSTTKGRHADRKIVGNLPYLLRDLHVFEVALGGGEPTLYPEFLSLVETFRICGVVPNFTTRNLAWLCAPVLSDPVIEQCGAFAFSAYTAAEVETLMTALEHRPNVRDKLTIQHIVGVAESPWAFSALLSVCTRYLLPVTLLGYKSIGRGVTLPEKPNPTWLDVVARMVRDDNEPLRIGIDTTLVDTWWGELLDAGVPRWCLTRHEGKFSCYFDAVTSTLYPSSHGDHPGVVLGGLDGEEFQKAYASF